MIPPPKYCRSIIAPLCLIGILLIVVAFINREDDINSFLRIRGTDKVSMLLKHDNRRPVVGILTQPHDDGREYISASYVKYAEAAGAKVIPLRYWWSEKQLKAAFKGINGILFPGGGGSVDPSISKIYRAAAILYTEAEKSNKIGQRFPIWGTCLGWELLATLASNYSILSDSGKFLHPGLASPLKEVDFSSRMFQGISKKIERFINKEQKLFYFAHEYGVTPQMFRIKLDQKCWRVTALATDLEGKYFVSGAENKCRPYFGVQFHPEKPLFEWYTKVDIPHTFGSNEVSRHFISVLDQELRWSRPGIWKDAEELVYDIHNFPVTTNGDSYYFQEYLFPSNKEAGFEEPDAREPAQVTNSESSGSESAVSVDITVDVTL